MTSPKAIETAAICSIMAWLRAVPHSRYIGHIVRFGPFEVDVQQGVLSKHGIRIKLQAQPFQVLIALLEKPGMAVTRDELRHRLWPDNTFVDFEHGLNAAVRRLRQALGDSAEHPRYIETFAKHGYRFTGKVEEEPPVEIKGEQPAQLLISNGKRKLAFWAAAAALLGLGAAVPLNLRLKHSDRSESRAALPLTSFRGREFEPALSPDASRVAFSWNGEKQDNFDIYVMPIGSSSPFRLTSDPGDDLAAAWSPDGRRIAFLRRSNTERIELKVVPSNGGPEHTISEIRDYELSEPIGRLASLAWSPDGREIAASHRSAQEVTERIYLFSLTGETRQLTSPSGPFGDHMPTFSPDGRTLAFTRLGGYSTSEIHVLSLDAELRPANEPRQLTRAKRWSVNPSWAEGGQSLFFISAFEPTAPRELRMIFVSGSAVSERQIRLNDEPFELTGGRHLVYSRQNEDTNIWRARIPSATGPPAIPEILISTTRRDDKARYSPDGQKIAFVSTRSGTPEIWVAKADGSNPVCMTHFGGPLMGYMNWSPDGQWLVFHARPEGHADLFVIPAAGGPVKQLTTDIADDTMPSYSRDGRWIYYSSARSGQMTIWRMPAAGGQPVQLTTSTGIRPQESFDGKSIFFLAWNTGEIMKMPATGGEAIKVVGGPMHDRPFGYVVAEDGIYYPARPHSGKQRFIRFLSFATGESRPIALASHAFHYGMSVSPDSKYILFDQHDESGSDLMLIENFRP